MQEEIKHTKNLFTAVKEFYFSGISLIREHIKLFRHEISARSSTFIKAAILLLIAAVFGLSGFIYLGFIVISIASSFISPFMGLILVTAIYLGVTLILLIYSLALVNRAGKKQLKATKEIQNTKKEAKLWLKNLKK